MVYDVIIIGAGSAGMAAAIYAARFNLKVLVIGQVVGGLLNESHNVENYPGFAGIPGLDLMMKFKEHCDSLNIPFKDEWVKDLAVEHKDDPKKRRFTVTTDTGDGTTTHESRTLIIATGAKHRHLGAKGEDALSGKGVSYCATCDAAFYRNIPVAVVGGGDAAALAANLVKEFASHVYVIVRGSAMKAEPINRSRIEQSDKVTIIHGTNVTEVLGDTEVTGVRLSAPYNGSDILPVNGVFIEIGQVIQSELAIPLGVARNERGEIIINGQSETNVPGVYAAGDVANRTYKQALTGAAEGAIAAFGAYALLQRAEHKNVDVGY